MKIVSISHLFPNNSEPLSGNFIKERLKYVNRKITLTMVAPVNYHTMLLCGIRNKKFNNIQYQEIFDGIFVYHPRYFTMPRILKFSDGLFYYFSLKKLFERIIKVENIDLLDFHWVFPDAFAGLKLSKKFRKPIVVTIRGDRSIAYHEHGFRKQMVINVLQSVDHVIAVSNELKEKVVREYGVKENNITVIQNGLDTHKFPAIDKSKARMNLGLPLNKKIILSLSRLSIEKGLEYLLRGLGILNSEHVELMVVGKGPLEKKLKTLSHRLNISDKVRFIGEVAHEETYKWYNAADVYCLPSLWEGCPNSIIESLACGTPVLATQVGGIPDLVPDEKYGLLVPPRDEFALSKALEDALNRTWDRPNIRKFGCSNTWDNVADKVINVFNSVLGYHRQELDLIE
jgi:glycosyltransferase involved in cell wall biosynthesis